jgi:hypothetical protein
MATTSVDDRYEHYGPGAKLLFKSGWQHGQKLGRFEQGLSKPITVIKRQDRVGLGAEQKTVWNDLWWERYLSEAINKNLQRFERSTTEKGEDIAEESTVSRKERKKKKKKKSSSRSKKRKERAIKEDGKKRKARKDR